MSSQDPSLTEAQSLYSSLAKRSYALGRPALEGAMTSLTGAPGGIDQTAKFSGLQTDVLESARPGQDQGSSDIFSSIGRLGQATAIGESSAAQQKVLSGVDEINKIRSMLGSQGLRTTALGVTAAQTGVEALAQVPRHQTESAVFAGLGLGAAAYGAYANRPGEPPPSTAQERTFSQQPLFGSETFYKMGAASGQPLTYFGGRGYSG